MIKRFAASGGLLLAITSVAAASSPLPLGSNAAPFVLKDVAIIGGGASGAYAAVRLKEDFKKSVILIEKESRLGGHVSTYDDPVSGKSYDFGVQNWNDYGPAAAFFARMNVSVGAPARTPLVSNYVDFTTGLAVNYSAPASADRTAALAAFLAAILPYEDMLLPGYWNFPRPDAIPADLLLPFGEFVAKYHLQAAVNQVFEVTGMGVGDMINTPALYVIQAFGGPMIRNFLGQAGALAPTSRRNIEIYEAVAKRLGGDVLYSSTVTQAVRTSAGVTLLVKDAKGKTKLVVAKKLLIAIEPTAENMEPFELDKTEKEVFGKFKYSKVHAGVVSHPSLPVNVSLVNTPASASPANYLELPKPNFIVRFDYLGSNLWRVLMVGDDKFDQAAAQQLVRDNFQDMVAAGTLPPSLNSDAVEIKAWANHGAMHMRVSVEELKAGFVQKQYALQGRRSTWFTGGAWSVQFQSVLWAFDDILLPKMLATK
ncbi:hypothetical protein B0H66DRAFT_513480 [Apodospora peruviana]|uniref:Amine oxidase n=1 Tax=Apodospora peruviana TaxID=516989 RepID=A0AAE0MC77_9PEZI|nr:hypothetical protein B0H66DRAFT_513480 [Apodospora peruviana]